MKEDWNRLADYVITGRVRRGLDRRAFADHLTKVGFPVTERTLGTLESGKSVSISTVAAVEIGLDWEPGSARAILQGGSPTPSEDPEPAATERNVSWGELLNLIEDARASDDRLVYDALMAVKRLRDARRDRPAGNPHGEQRHATG